MKNYLLTALLATVISAPAFAADVDVTTHGIATQSTTVGGPAGSFTKTETIKTKNGAVVDHDMDTSGNPAVAADAASSAATPDLTDTPIVPGVAAETAPLATAPLSLPDDTNHVERVTTTTKVKTGDKEKVTTDTTYTEKKAQ